MKDINWVEFKRKNKNPPLAFQDLCYFLFSREFGLSNGVFGYKNQTGIEKEPVKSGSQYIGFQCKFFEHKVDWNSLKSDIEKAKQKNPKLNTIRLYINLEFSESSEPSTKKSKAQEKLEAESKKKGIQIEWFGPGQFLIALNRPVNLDLAQLYFGESNEFNFIQDGVEPRYQTFIQSDEYINLPLTKDGKTITKPVGSILNTKKKSFLIVGHPGAGKSIFMHALFRDFGALDKQTPNQMAKVLLRNSAVPMLINLKNCNSENLEALIRSRQVDSLVRGQELGFIYLLDGLDELSEDKADQVLAYVEELNSKEETKKVVISCRSGNPNRLKVPIYLKDIVEFKFCDLGLDYIDKFFANKKRTEKTKLLTKLKKSNTNLLKDVRDILLIRLLWEIIEKLGSHSTITDLIEQKIIFLLKDPHHKKNIDNLNLLDIKSDEVIALNQEISYLFQQKFQYRFSHKELQKIILEKFERLDYKGVNDLINYLSNIFFENNRDGTDPSPSFIYQHRRYQEFFFTQRLKTEYEKDPTVLRKLDMIANRDYLENYFLPYLRKDYEVREYIPGLLDLNLLDVYLGNHRGFGVDDSYYLNSSEFIPALTNQSIRVREEILESENFQIKDILFIDIEVLKEKFALWNKDPRDFSTSNYVESIWGSAIASSIEHIRDFWENGDHILAKKLIDNLRDAQDVFRENNFFEKRDKNRPLDDPFWKRWGDYLFFLLYIRKINIKKIFVEEIRNRYPASKENESKLLATEENGKEKLVKSFFRIILESDLDFIIREVQDFDDFEFLALLEILLSHLKTFLKNNQLKKKIIQLLRERNLPVTEETYFLGFYKKLLGLDISKEEETSLRAYYNKIRDKNRFDWRMYDMASKYSQISYALGINNFRDLDPDPNDSFRYYNEGGLYSALFTALIGIIQEETTLGATLRSYIKYVEKHTERTGLYLKVDTSFLWAELFSVAGDKITFEKLSALKRRLLEEDTNVIPFSFYYRLVSINKKLFDKLVSESEITTLEGVLKKPEDYQSLVNDCLSFSMFYSRIDERKSLFFFTRAIKESLLRHGWRKDDIVSYKLVGSLEVLWRNNWVTDQELRKFIQEVFDLTLKVSSFTDGKGTWRGPYNVLDLAAKFDIKLAESLKDKLIEHQGYSNFSNEAITSVLFGKVRLGLPLEEIEKGMSEYKNTWDHEGKPRADSFEQKIRVYIEICESDLYEEAERKIAFDKAYDLVEKLKSEKVSYYLNDTYFEELKRRYLSYSKEYNKEPNLQLSEEGGTKESVFAEEKLLKIIKKLNTKSQIKGFYKKLENYQNNFVLSKKETWEELIKKTYKVCGNIQPLIKLLKRFSFPHTDWSTTNSKYFYIPLAIALGDINTRPEAIRHLFRDTGHGGFSNMLDTYEFLGDKQMCRILFMRYLKLCHLLSD